MSTQKIPQMDSIHALAEFWETHDLTDFEPELEEVTDTVFDREMEIRIRIPSNTAEAVRSLAQSQGMNPSELVRQWVLQRIETWS